MEKVKSELGFDSVYNGSAFADYPIDLSGFSKVLFSGLPDDVHDDSNDPADPARKMTVSGNGLPPQRLATIIADDGFFGNAAEHRQFPTHITIEMLLGTTN